MAPPPSLPDDRGPSPIAGSSAVLESAVSGFEREHVPVPATLPDPRGSNLLSRKTLDRVIPEAIGRLVGDYDANLPAPRKALPHQVGDLSADACASISPQDKELRNIPHHHVGRFPRQAVNQRETCKPGVDVKQEWMPRGLSPVNIKIAVAKPPVRPDFQLYELGEVVLIEFKQIGQDCLLLQRGRNDFDIGSRLLGVG